MVDIDVHEIIKTENISLEINADVNKVMTKLKEIRLKVSSNSSWIKYCVDLKKRYPVVSTVVNSDEPVDLYMFTHELCEQLNSTDVIVPESSGAAGEVTYQALRVKYGQSIKNAAGLGAMGFGLPYAIGSYIALERRTILVNGDGAFQLNIQELETIRRLQIPIKMFIWDNGGYIGIANTQRNMFNGLLVGAEASSGFTLPDIREVASSYKIRTTQIQNNGELSEGIAETLDGDDPVLCQVMVRLDHSTIPRVQSMRLPDGGMASKPLEEMSPDLSAEELAENMRIATAG